MGSLKLHRNVKLRLTEQLLSRIAANAALPFMIVYYVYEWGALLAGAAMALHALAAILSNFYGGYTADRYGRRKVMLYSEFSRIIAYIIMAISISPLVDQPFIVFSAYLVVGICSGLSKPAGQAMLIDVSEKDNKKFIFGFDYWSNNLALLVGLLVGGILFEDYKVFLVIALAGTSLLSFIFLKFLIVETYEVPRNIEKKKVLRSLFDHYKIVSFDKIFMLFILASFLDMAIETQATNFLSVRLVNEFVEQPLVTLSNYTLWIDGYKMYSFLYSINTITVLIFGLIISALINKFNIRILITIGLLLYSIGYASLSFGTNPWLLLGIMIPLTIGEIIYATTKMSLLADLAPETNRSSYMAVNDLSYRAAIFVAPFAVMINAFIPSWGISILFVSMGLISINIYNYILSKVKDQTSDKEESKVV